jgi:murein DD-endopeptidase MepM/ murein hydrolase activator NlpD
MTLSYLQQRRWGKQLASLGIADAEPLLANAAQDSVQQPGELNIKPFVAITLSGIVSCLMMACAIFVAFDGRASFSTYSSALLTTSERGSDRIVEGKTDRERPEVLTTPKRRTFTLSLAERDGRRMQLSNQTVEWLGVSLATSATNLTANVPALEDIVGDASTTMASANTQIPRVASRTYGNALDTEVAITVEPMEISAMPTRKLSDAAARDFISKRLPMAPATPLTALAYAEEFSSIPSVDPLIVSSVPENVTIVPKRNARTGSTERLIKLQEPSLLTEQLRQNGFKSGETAQIIDAVGNVFGLTKLPARARLRIFYRASNGAEESRPVRLSVYFHDKQSNADEHAFTVARTDTDRFVLAVEPPSIPFPEESTERVDPTVLPTLYRSIWETGRRNDLPDDVIKNLVSILRNDLDLRETVAPGDRLEILKANTPTNESVLYASLVTKGETRELFRFTDRSGAVGYFDHKGSSGGPLLLRRPLEGGGILTSPMGIRVHPVTGRRLGHEGVDLAATAGTPIYAGGDGEVTVAGWNGNYGRQVQLKHENGFETSYSHMSRIADGIVPGTEVKQGQVVGFVGTTGLSTGNHLHYEVTVNDRLVDALSVRLPPRSAVTPGDMQNFNAMVGSIEQVLEAETPTQ